MQLTYFPLIYVAKYTDIMSEYLKAPLLASLRTGRYALYNDKTQDISSTEQMAICAAFEHRNRISEHYIGILPISELVGSHLSVPDIFGALNKYLQEMNILLSDGRFFCMGITNVNSGEQSDLKRLLKHAGALGNLFGCGNHKVALCFKYLNDFPDVLSANATFLALWKFFHYHPLAINFLKNAPDTYEKCHVIPASPSVTRWTAHDRACKSLCDGYKQILSALSTCVNERNEPDVLGIFREISFKRFLANILMLCDVFAAIQPLNQVLQKAGGSLCLAYIPVYLEKTINSLDKLKTASQHSHFRKDKHNIFVKSAVTEILNFPPVAGTLSNLQFDLCEFEEKVFIPFLDALIAEVKEAFS